MDAPDRFETKRGVCRFEGNRLVLEGSVRGYVRNIYHGYYRRGGLGGTLIFLGVVGAVPAALCTVGLVLLTGADVTPLLIGVGAAGSLWVALFAYRWSFRGVRRDDAIPLEAIQSVTLVEGRRWLTRPRFIVTYERDGRERRRYVPMPSLLLPNGRAELERAAAAFRARGFAVDAT